MSGKSRVFSKEFKVSVAQRILNGESVSAIHHEFQIKRSVLYRWRDAYRKDGAAGLQRPVGRPPGVPNPPRSCDPEEAAARRIAELEHTERIDDLFGRDLAWMDWFELICVPGYGYGEHITPSRRFRLQGGSFPAPVPSVSGTCRSQRRPTASHTGTPASGRRASDPANRTCAWRRRP